MNLIKIGKFITEQRKQKKLTQEKLAEKLGINNRTISRWENGINMPDASLYKKICEVLEISIEELINGEKTNKENIRQSYEKALITTVDANNKQERRINKLLKILVLAVSISIISIIIIIIYYAKKYPKIDIYNMNVIESDKNELNNKLTLNQKDYKIYFYGIDSLQVSNIDNNYYDLKIALQYKQVTIDKVKKYLNDQYKNNNINRATNSNKEIEIYKHNNYEVIICNTKDNKDLYFGTPNIASNLKGEYCGKKIKEPCSFTRTYKVLKLQKDNDYNYVNLTLKQYQAETILVRIKRNDKLKEGKNYEFTFITYEKFEDNMENIFNYSEIIDIKETNKLGMDQIMQGICIN
ncbi:MAG: helix-turn-helix transcriptional regulator [Bacilli bacterium]|nr:helix-turn-helix transcriptional regulator [Bacilli bacterium]